MHPTLGLALQSIDELCFFAGLTVSQWLRTEKAKETNAGPQHAATPSPEPYAAFLSCRVQPGC